MYIKQRHRSDNWGGGPLPFFAPDPWSSLLYSTDVASLIVDRKMCTVLSNMVLDPIKEATTIIAQTVQNPTLILEIWPYYHLIWYWRKSYPVCLVSLSQTHLAVKWDRGRYSVSAKVCVCCEYFQHLSDILKRSILVNAALTKAKEGRSAHANWPFEPFLESRIPLEARSVQSLNRQLS